MRFSILSKVGHCAKPLVNGTKETFDLATALGLIRRRVNDEDAEGGGNARQLRRAVDLGIVHVEARGKAARGDSFDHERSCKGHLIPWPEAKVNWRPYPLARSEGNWRPYPVTRCAVRLRYWSKDTRASSPVVKGLHFGYATGQGNRETNLTPDRDRTARAE